MCKLTGCEVQVKIKQSLIWKWLSKLRWKLQRAQSQSSGRLGALVPACSWPGCQASLNVLLLLHAVCGDIQLHVRPGWYLPDADMFPVKNPLCVVLTRTLPHFCSQVLPDMPFLKWRGILVMTLVFVLFSRKYYGMCMRREELSKLIQVFWLIECPLSRGLLAPKSWSFCYLLLYSLHNWHVWSLYFSVKINQFHC